MARVNLTHPASLLIQPELSPTGGIGSARSVVANLLFKLVECIQ
jgi:hypothetical protein